MADIRLSEAIEQPSVPGIEGDLDSSASGASGGGSEEAADDEPSPGDNEKSGETDSQTDTDGESVGSEDPSDLDDMIESDQTETSEEELYEGGDARRKPSNRGWEGVGVLAVALILVTGTTSLWRRRRERSDG
jgi:hypothetical protein